eukprot:5697613-Pyramimonas_sp.AAC.1
MSIPGRAAFTQGCPGVDHGPWAACDNADEFSSYGVCKCVYHVLHARWWHIPKLSSGACAPCVSS